MDDEVLQKTRPSVTTNVDKDVSKTENAVAYAGEKIKGSGLAAYEAAGWHLIERHIGKTEADLAKRLNSDSKISGASSFTNEYIADEVISEAITANKNLINDFLNSNNKRLVINYTSTKNLGIVLTRGDNNAISTKSMRMVIERNNNMPFGYHIVTGFPTK